MVLVCFLAISHPGPQGHSPSLFISQCLALRAQIAAFTAQDEHTQRLEKSETQAPAGRAAADPSEKVSWHSKKQPNLSQLIKYSENYHAYVLLTAFLQLY